jgi:hypothetical protein
MANQPPMDADKIKNNSTAEARRETKAELLSNALIERSVDARVEVALP